MRICVVAPSTPIREEDAARVTALAAVRFPEALLDFHPQCFLAHNHFAGTDRQRADAFLEAANDPGVDAVWFARGGYGSCRIAEEVLAGLGDAARAVAAAREPDRVVGRIVGDLDEGFEPRAVVAGEMAGAQEALRVDNDLRRAVEEAVGGEGFETRRQSFVDARAGRDDADADAWGHVWSRPCRRAAFLVITGANESS